MPNAKSMDLKAYPEAAIIAGNLIRWRLEAGWNQRELARLVDTSQSLISVIETAGTDIRLSTLARLARIFNRPVWHFFLVDPPERP